MRLVCNQEVAGSSPAHSSMKKKYNYKRKRINGVNTYIHRHVLEQKLGRKLAPNEVSHHIDEIPFNNDPDNLECKTRLKHSKEHKLLKNIHPNYEQQARGERIGISKLTVKIVLEIRERIRNGEVLQDIARNVGVNESTISRIKSGKIWAHVVKE